MPFLTDDQIQKLVSRAVAKALKPRTTSEQELAELIAEEPRPSGFAREAAKVSNRFIAAEYKKSKL